MQQDDGKGYRAGSWRFAPALVSLAAFLWFCGFLGPVGAGQALDWSIAWIPSMGIELAFRIDGLALAFALLICGIGALVFLYAAEYFRTDTRVRSLLILLVLFAVSMLGLVLADDLMTLFVFWEATTIASFLLVGFDHEKPHARRCALQALLVTGIGGLALLAGLVLMAGATGNWRLSELVASGDMLRDHALYPAIFILVVLGAFTKSAQFPFHFWLPGAMAAPTPVSAYLHSATMVKAGVYLLARLAPALGGTDAWFWTLSLFGGATMLLGAVWALRQTDLKLLMAHTTVMALGLLVLLLGLGSAAAVTAAMAFLIVHALYKASLFLGVGLIDKGAGTREYPLLGGLLRVMPMSAAAIGLAALSMAGIPPFIGFIGKELIYASAGGIAVVALLLANALMVVAAGAVALRPFLGARVRAAKAPADPGWGLWLGPMVLAVLGLLSGLFAGVLEHYLVAPMIRSAGHEFEGHLVLWHGFNTALALGVLTWVLGALLFLRLDRLRLALDRAAQRLPRTEGWYDGMMEGLVRIARLQTGVIQSGRMTRYLRVSFITLAALIWGAILLGQGAWPDALPRLSLIEVVILGIIMASAIAVVRTGSRLAAITALGGVGAGVAMIFVLYGAIDVAMTQLFVEILVVVFVAIVMVRLPSAGRVRFRPGNAVVATVLGLGVTAVMLAVLGTGMDRRLTDFFEAASYPEAFGRNIVNVILVDFRGFDTLGEITVVVIAGIAAVAALRAGREVRK
ncbi:MAG: hydrogen gas-evolving membrane-bound hydrogenase subunit E [Gemmobacter sp.]